MAEEKQPGNGKVGNSPIAEEVWNRRYAPHVDKPLKQLLEEGKISPAELVFAEERRKKWIKSSVLSRLEQESPSPMMGGNIQFDEDSNKWKIKVFDKGIGDDKWIDFNYTKTIDPITGNPLPARVDPAFHRQVYSTWFVKDYLPKQYNPEEYSPEVARRVVELKSALSHDWDRYQVAVDRNEAVQQLRAKYPFLDRIIGDVESDAFKDSIGGIRTITRNMQAGPDSPAKQTAVFNGDKLAKQALLHKFLSEVASEYRPFVSGSEWKLQEKVFKPILNAGLSLEKLTQGHLDATRRSAASAAPFLIEGMGSAPMLGDIHRYMKGGFDTKTGQTYYPSELTDVDGVKKPTEVVSQMARLHPDNAKQNPDVTDEERRKFNPAWFKEADEKKANAEKEFRQRTGAKGPVPMETPAPRKTAVINLTSGDFFTT
jgi:hypothetical protein